MNTYSLLHSTDGDKNEANPKALLKMNRTGQSLARTWPFAIGVQFRVANIPMG